MIASIVARTAAVTITVYMTKRVGVWGQSEESERLYHQVIHGLKPLGGLVRDLLPLPDPEKEMNMGQMARDMYNRGIKDGFYILQNLPKISNQLAIKAKEACYDLAKELSGNMGIEIASKKIDPPAEKPTTFVIVTPGTPLKGLGEGDGTTTSSTTTTPTSSTDLALKQGVKAGWTPSIFHPSSKNDKSH
ncbi:MICOS complex subunit MIC13 homolog QIL1 [Drosophila serrata]|uniref:MICOS complex subunit MIC13 homolog QIL1 n=1 Tax=Drosophila serrata TaxID=7274 RepID=UPI000A1D21F6|nr:MICOS complex subunit MIC13 homolog QIL1 [Drosophila serrata]